MDPASRERFLLFQSFSPTIANLVCLGCSARFVRHRNGRLSGLAETERHMISKENLYLLMRKGYEKIPVLHDVLLRRRIRREWSKGKAGGFLPRQLAIETSSFCNAKCIMCPTQEMSRPRGFMSTELHRLVVDKVAEWRAPISIISHAGLGEPLLDRGLFEKIQYEKKVFEGAQIAVYTNGSLLDGERSQMVLEAGVDELSFSLNAFRKETYEAVMKLAYERTVENIHKFLEMNKAKGSPVKVHVSLIPTDLHSREEIDQFSQYWIEKVSSVAIPPLISWGGFLRHHQEKKQWPCRYLWEVFQVDWDGTVKMCCEDFDSRYPLGNIAELKPMKIFNSPRMQKQRLDQVNGNFEWPEICRNCIESHEVARDFWKSASLASGA